MENLEHSKLYVDWFRHSSPYINAHRDKTFVLLLGGDAIAHPNFELIVHDIALLNSLGVKLVLVHGARPQMEQQLGPDASSYHQGLRVTDAGALAAMVQACGSVRAQIEAKLSMGLPNSPMHLSRIKVCSGNFVTAKPLGVRDGVDYQHTGEVRRVDTDAIQQLLAQRAIVLLSPLGFSPTGEIFNLLAEDVAGAAASQLQAEKLIAFSDNPGILDGGGQLLRQLSIREAIALRSQFPAANSPTLMDTIIQANQSGVERCHVVGHAENGALIKELFTRDGCGSLVLHDNYENTRQADIEDVGGILELIAPLEQAGVLVRRSREKLETEISRFTVIERDGMVIACAALYTFDKESCGELACVVTHPLYRGDQRGVKLLTAIERQARNAGLKSLFVLTTHTAHWFIEQGFVAASTDQLPKQRQALYNLQRNSKVFFKQL